MQHIVVSLISSPGIIVATPVRDEAYLDCLPVSTQRSRRLRRVSFKVNVSPFRPPKTFEEVLNHFSEILCLRKPASFVSSEHFRPGIPSPLQKGADQQVVGL
jgi:hypothetical protein